MQLRYLAENPEDNAYLNLTLPTLPHIHELPKCPLHLTSSEIKCVQELLDTELTYVQQLRILVKICSQPLRQLQIQGNPVIQESSWRLIFGDIESILALSEKFYEKLHQNFIVNAENDANSFHSPHYFVLLAFTDLVKYFKLYSSYFKSYEEGTEELLKVLDVSFFLKSPTNMKYLVTIFISTTLTHACMKHPSLIFAYVFAFDWQMIDQNDQFAEIVRAAEVCKTHPIFDIEY